MNFSYNHGGSLLPTLVPGRLHGPLPIFIAGSGSLTAAFTHFSLTSESLISLLEPDFERGFYSLNPAALLIARMALV